MNNDGSRIKVESPWHIASSEKYERLKDEENDQYRWHYLNISTRPLD
jgi:hypothetical protein